MTENMIFEVVVDAAIIGKETVNIFSGHCANLIQRSVEELPLK